MDHGTISMLLRSSGWKERDIVEALAQTSLGMPVPAPPDTAGAREAFLHLVVFAALYSLVIGVTVLLFQFIERAFPDPAFQPSWYVEEGGLSIVRWNVALCIVSFPVLIWVSRLLLLEIRAQPEKAASGVRRWLTYLTLFVASLALGGDGITLLSRLLEGELTLRFLLKVLVVLLVAGMTFSYFFLSLRLQPTDPRAHRLHSRFAGAASVLVAATVIWGLVLAGSPGERRLVKLDERRLADLESIVDEIERLALGETGSDEAQQRRLVRPLPQTLEEVAAQAVERRPQVRDPVTGELYGYSVTGEAQYRLCASFDSKRSESRNPRWNHPAGPHCFSFDLLSEEGFPDEPR